MAVYDTGEEREVTGSWIPFIVMELIEDGPSAMRCGRKERVSARLSAGIDGSSAGGAGLAATPLASSTATQARQCHAHQLWWGQVADFGIARAASDTTGTVTLAGTVLWTPRTVAGTGPR